MGKVLAVYALLALSAFSPSAAPAGPSGAAGAVDEQSTRLRFDADNNLIVINATLNGRGPYRFLLDTGASHHVIKPELAQALGLEARGDAEIDGGGRENVIAGLVRVAEVRVGGFTLESQQFLVAPFPSLYPFDGFLGAELFRRFTVSIDFRQSTVTLFRPGAFRYRGAGVELPLKFHGGLIPQVKAEVDEKAGWFKLDTGYNGSLALFGNFIERHGLLAKYGAEKSAPGGTTLTGEVGDSPVARIRRFRLGAVALDDVPASFFLEKGGSNSAFAGAVGTALLKRFHVVIDYTRRRLILERGGASASTIRL